MAAIKGRLAELWVASGTGSAITKEACEAVGSSTTRFHITAAAKRYLDPATAVLVYDDDVLQTSGYHIEGGCHIVFDSAPTAVTVSGAYLTPAEITLVQGWELNLEMEIYEITALGATARTYQSSGLLGWSGSFERFYESAAGEADPPWYAAAVANASKIIVRLFEDQPSGYVWTGWATPTEWTQSVPLELERETFGFTGEGMPVYTTDEG